MRSARVLFFTASLVVSLASSSLAAQPDGTGAKLRSQGATTRSAWPMFGFDAAHTGSNPNETVLGTSNVASLALTWSRSTGGREACCGSPIVSKGGTVIVPGGDFFAHAFDAATGAPRWTSSSQVQSFAGAISKGTVYLGTSSGVMALRVSSGHVLWSDGGCNGQQVNAPPIVANKTVYAGLNDPELIALEAATGACRWEGLARMSYDGGSSPALSNGVVYVGDDTGRLWSADAGDGSVRWHAAAVGIYSNANVSTPIATHRRAYASAADELGAYKASTGARVWAFGIGSDAVFGPPALADGVIYVGSSDGHVYAVDPSTGYEVWDASIGSGFGVHVSVANGVVYASSDKLYALDAATGSILWSGSTGTRGTGGSAPAIANGMVYVQGLNERIYAFGLPA
jgi:outer membrane protein assembly factor BamB